jgi:hypothetical protein
LFGKVLLPQASRQCLYPAAAGRPMDCDALNKTIFKEAEGRDSCVIELSAIKTKVESEDKAGAFIDILPIMVR